MQQGCDRMVSYQEMMMSAIEYDEVEVAYDLFYLISYGHINANDEYEHPDWNKIDKSIVNDWMEKDILKTKTFNLYCTRVNVDDWDIFMAKDDIEARGFMLQKYGFLPKIQKMHKNKWLSYFWLPESKEFKSLLDLRKESSVSPRTLLIV